MKNIIILFLLPIIAITISSCSNDDNTVSLEQLSFEKVVSFNGNGLEQPQGIAQLEDNNFLVSFPFLNELRIYSQSGILIESISDVPALSFMKTLSDGKVVLGAFAGLDPKFDGADPANPDNGPLFAANGVWIFDPSTLTLSQLANFAPGKFATHFAELDNGDLLVSDIISSDISLLTRSGELTLWSDDDLLAGDTNLPGPEGRPPFPVGIEGIRIIDGALMGVVADYGRIVEIKINSDNSAGEVTVLKENQTEMLGLAHFEISEEGYMVGISGFESKIMKIEISANGKVEVLADNSSDITVDTPSQITKGNNDDLYYVNFALIINETKVKPSPSITRIANFK